MSMNTERKTDRALGILFPLLVIALGAFGIWIEFPGIKWATGALLVIWATSWRKIPVGGRGQYTYFGGRIMYFVGEGLHCVPWILGFGCLIEDTRDKIHEFDPMSLFSSDGIEFRIEKAGLVYWISDVDRFRNLDATNLDRLLDEVIDEDVRQKVRGNVATVVLGMTFEVAEGQKVQDLKQWGIEVRRLIVPNAPYPVDPEIRQVLSGAAREKLETAIEATELKHILDQVKILVDEGGYTREQAIEQVQMTVNKAGKRIDVKQIVLSGDKGGSVAGAATLGALLDGGKGGEK